MDLFDRLLELANQGKQADVLTILEAPAERSETVGHIVIVPSGESPETLLEDSQLAAAAALAVRHKPWQKPDIITVECGGHYRFFWDKLTTPSAALVLGGGHISLPLVDMLSMVGYAVTILDDRPDFANPSRFVKAAQVICADFEKTIAKLNGSDYSAVVVVTRGHRSDMQCLRQLVNWPFGIYIGMIGSQRRVRGVVEALLAEGYDETGINRIKAPIGIDIGAQTPAEIAVSILAEIIGEKNQAKFRPLSEGRMKTHG